MAARSVRDSFFITFEGIEGSGKSTQIARLASRLQEAGRPVVVTREPGGCRVADAIRSILLSPEHAGMVPRAELLLYAAARAQHVEEVIRPALAAGRWVLCDRFVDATLAYQGYGRGLDPALIEQLNLLATGGLMPDLTLLLDLPAEDGLSRARERNALRPESNDDRFEREAMDFHRKVRDGYLRLAEGESRFRRIEAGHSPERVQELVAAAVSSFIAEHAAL